MRFTAASLALLLVLLTLVVDARRSALNRIPRPSSSSPSSGTRVSPVTGELIAVPNADLLRFQADEIAVLIHYNIATYLPVAHDGCNGDVSLTPPASVFNPYLLSTDNWSTPTLLALSRLLPCPHRQRPC